MHIFTNVKKIYLLFISNCDNNDGLILKIKSIWSETYPKQYNKLNDSMYMVAIAAVS